MIGADRDGNDAIGIGDRADPGDRMPDPWQTEAPGAQHRFLAADRADLPAIALPQGSKPRPEIGAGDATGRRAHLDDERGGLAFHGFGEVGRPVARHRNAGEPLAHLRVGGDRVDRRAHRLFVRRRLRVRGSIGHEHRRKQDGGKADHGRGPIRTSTRSPPRTRGSVAETGPLASASKNPSSSPAPVRNCSGRISPASSRTAW